MEADTEEAGVTGATPKGEDKPEAPAAVLLRLPPDEGENTAGAALGRRGEKPVAEEEEEEEEEEKDPPLTPSVLTGGQGGPSRRAL